MSKHAHSFQQTVVIFGREKTRLFWSVLTIAALVLGAMSAALFAMFTTFVSNTLGIRGDAAEFLNVAMGIVLMLIDLGFAGYMLKKLGFFKLNIFHVFTLILAGAAFSVNALTELHVFDELTTRTVVFLWVSFIALFIGLFRRKLPTAALPLLSAFFVLGAAVSACFVLPMAGFMLFSWAFIPFLGIGLLPYAPLCALIAFVLMFREIRSELAERNAPLGLRRLYTGLGAAMALCIFAYTGWYAAQWITIDEVLKQNNVHVTGPNRLDQDQPKWLRSAMQLPKNHVTRDYLLASGPSRALSRNFWFSGSIVYDPIASTMNFLFPRIKTDDWRQLLELLFDDSYSGMEQLWSSSNLSTSKVQTQVQLHPGSRLAYTETTITVFNDGDRQQEALYQLTLPQGSVASSLSLWINGKEEPARLTYKSRAHHAYRQIVGVESRDPSLLNWMDGGRLSLRVFPVLGKKSRVVKLGVISPLVEKDGKLFYRGAAIQGPSLLQANHDVRVEVFTHGGVVALDHSGVDLDELIVPDGQTPQWNGDSSYSKNWNLSLSKPANISGSFKLGDTVYKAGPLLKKSQKFYPEQIWLLLNQELTPAGWQELFRRLRKIAPDAQIHLAGRSWFYSNNDAKTLAYLRKAHYPLANHFPLYKLPADGKILLVTAGEDISVPLSRTRTRNSKFYEKTRKYLAKRSEPVFMASVNGRSSRYFYSLEETESVNTVARSREELFALLKSAQVSLPVNDDNHFSLPRAGLTLKLENNPGPAAGRQGGSNDALVRLAIYRRIMRKLGRRFYKSDTENKDLFKLAETAMIVTPVTSLVVLESEADYKRFGIDKNKSALGKSKTQPVGAVPEPEEWAFMILCLLLMVYWNREKLKNLLPGRFSRTGFGV